MKKIFRKHQEFIRFMLVGIMNTLFGASLMFILYNLFHVSYWWSSAANYFFGSILSFCLNKQFTFQVDYQHRQIMRFTLNIALCYLVSYGISKPLVEALLRQLSANLQDNISMLVGMVGFTILNYFGQRYFVFQKGEN
ncbi:Putative flippase GtrA (transmembrane translocase of bactoprenol-linked glucose) [Granulicatella balaenopterae]|uniref:Putative flippase GtrA (Transmembrane translocase of bactoprenol-linked glucose) n=1 Tax=Granulicatella balaenopterae TaxID=137733 RepID=A0A1H9LZY4_9LACT|nr:GtrA family protein [Granulicatella balaenopterae]SER16982.1 Putative flippase GtrA (transmembrane translocase of bactoprenol-linked glucose) [Granulicatella balaenopterae]